MDEKKRCVLAVDQATTCGWALLSGEELVSGVWDLKSSRFQSEGMRLIKFRTALNEIKTAYPGLQLVLFEELRFSKYADASAINNQLVGVLKTWCLDNAVEYAAVPVATVKKFATGKGNANKEAMLDAARKRWPLVSFTDDNEADARWILLSGVHEYLGNPKGANA